jgi:hypothetical protein
MTFWKRQNFEESKESVVTEGWGKVDEKGEPGGVQGSEVILCATPVVETGHCQSAHTWRMYGKSRPRGKR